jgi:hypothetical protein
VVEKILAGIVLLVCVVLLVRLSLGTRRRLQFDFAMQRLWHALRRNGTRAWRWPRARRETRDAIERARSGEWDGNVYRPKSFRRPKKPH